jgi:hypothetical protein
MPRTLAITIAVLFCLWLGSVAVLLCFLAALVGIPALVGAIVVQVGVACVGGGIILVTNTRRPAGRDPDAPLRAADPYAATTDQLMREAVLLADGQPYGRRDRDDHTVVKRSLTEQISDLVEAEAARRPSPAKTPAWAIDLARDNESHAAARDMFPDPPSSLSNEDV